jgi:hypothetical protein
MLMNFSSETMEAKASVTTYFKCLKKKLSTLNTVAGETILQKEVEPGATGSSL